MVLYFVTFSSYLFSFAKKFINVIPNARRLNIFECSHMHYINIGDGYVQQIKYIWIITKIVSIVAAICVLMHTTLSLNLQTA